MIEHPPKNDNKYFYFTDVYFEYEIGRALEYFTKKMVDFGIRFETYQVDIHDRDTHNEYRPHHKIYPYENNIIYMYSDGKYGYSIDTYKLTFNPIHNLSVEQAKFITSLFCNDDKFYSLNKNGDVENVKDWVDYLTFQIPIRPKEEALKNGEMGGRFIVELQLNKFVSELRKEKIEKILKDE